MPRASSNSDPVLDSGEPDPSGGLASDREKLRHFLDSKKAQGTIVTLIIVNALVLGLETDPNLQARYGTILGFLDRICLLVFVLEIALRMFAEGRTFWRHGWNWFDAGVVGVALIPGSGPWAVLRSLRVLRVLRLLTIAPQMRRVVAAFLHSIPGLSAVISVMLVFFYTAGVLATTFFGSTYPNWFGSLGKSLYSLFQIMTLESWSMGIVRPVMETHPWAWAFFVPFIVIATFTILNLFIGIIVSTMQELSQLPDPGAPAREAVTILARVEEDLRELRALLPAEAKRQQREP